MNWINTLILGLILAVCLSAHQLIRDYVDKPIIWLNKDYTTTVHKHKVCYSWEVDFDYDHYGERVVKVCRLKG